MQPALPNAASTAMCENTESQGAWATVDNSGPGQFQKEKKKKLVCAWTGPAFRVADWRDRQWESEVRQMEGVTWVRERLAGGPARILLLEQRQPQQPGNLLSSQACSFRSAEICYQGRTRRLG